MHEEAIARAAGWVRSAEALFIGAGAGMGVDSGLPDFRGPEGFWKAYPVFQGRQFAEISTPHWFRTDPELAWGFFGHRLGLYRYATPHAGFRQLLEWGRRTPRGLFVFTSNVDGQFQKAGFPEESIVECHGSIHHLQCTARCGQQIWSAEGVSPVVDLETIRASRPLPVCPACGALARPNILMFSDHHWDPARRNAQCARYQAWLRTTEGSQILAIELGAGTAIPTVRYECEGIATQVIRINPRDSDSPPRGVALPLGAAAALARIAEAIAK